MICEHETYAALRGLRNLMRYEVSLHQREQYARDLRRLADAIEAGFDVSADMDGGRITFHRSDAERELRGTRALLDSQAEMLQAKDDEVRRLRELLSIYDCARL